MNRGEVGGRCGLDVELAGRCAVRARRPEAGRGLVSAEAVGRRRHAGQGGADGVVEAERIGVRIGHGCGTGRGRDLRESLSVGAAVRAGRMRKRERRRPARAATAETVTCAGPSALVLPHNPGGLLLDRTRPYFVFPDPSSSEAARDVGCSELRLSLRGSDVFSCGVPRVEPSWRRGPWVGLGRSAALRSQNPLALKVLVAHSLLAAPTILLARMNALVLGHRCPAALVTESSGYCFGRLMDRRGKYIGHSIIHDLSARSPAHDARFGSTFISVALARTAVAITTCTHVGSMSSTEREGVGGSFFVMFSGRVDAGCGASVTKISGMTICVVVSAGIGRTKEVCVRTGWKGRRGGSMLSWDEVCQTSASHDHICACTCCGPLGASRFEAHVVFCGRS
jgi:hypothetical protein